MTGAALIEASSGNIGIYRGIPMAYGQSSSKSLLSRQRENQGRSLDPQKKPQENSCRIFYSLKYIPYTHSTCRIYSLLVPGILESRMSQETASYWQSPSSRETKTDPLFRRKRLNRAWTYLRCDRKLQRRTQTNVLQPKRCHQLAFPGCCRNFLEAQLLSESSPQPPSR